MADAADHEDEVAMHIRFPAELPRYCGQDLVVVFPVLIDGERTDCAVTVEALEDHFGAASLREDDVLGAFAAHRADIERAVRRFFAAHADAPAVLHSGWFRFDH